jgi:hypothetical protein
MILIPFPDLQRTPRELKWQLISNTQGFNGSPEQVSELAGARWAAQFEYNLNLMSRHDARKLKAFLTKLRGRAGRFTLHNMARPEPRGDGRFYSINENRLQRSEDFSNGYWGKSQSTILADAAVAPDGLTTMDAVRASAVVTSHYVDTNLTTGITAGMVTAESIFIKQGAARRVQFLCYGVGNWNHAVIFDFSTQAVTFSSDNGGGQVSIARGVSHVVDDIWRFYIVGYPDTSGTNRRFRVTYSDAAGNFSFAGDGTTNMLYLWGAMLNAGSSVGGYVPTTTAAITNRLGPYVYGAGQTGNSLVVWGWQESITGILKAGDFFSVNGELKMVTADANTDALGRTTLQFEPPLRSAPPDLAQVTVDQPTGTFMLTEDIVQWSTNGPGLVNIPISCIEAI